MDITVINLSTTSKLIIGERHALEVSSKTHTFEIGSSASRVNLVQLGSGTLDLSNILMTDFKQADGTTNLIDYAGGEGLAELTERILNVRLSALDLIDLPDAINQVISPNTESLYAYKGFEFFPTVPDKTTIPFPITLPCADANYDDMAPSLTWLYRDSRAAFSEVVPPMASRPTGNPWCRFLKIDPTSPDFLADGETVAVEILAENASTVFDGTQIGQHGSTRALAMTEQYADAALASDDPNYITDGTYSDVIGRPDAGLPYFFMLPATVSNDGTITGLYRSRPLSVPTAMKWLFKRVGNRLHVGLIGDSFFALPTGTTQSFCVWDGVGAISNAANYPTLYDVAQSDIGTVTPRIALDITEPIVFMLQLACLYTAAGVGTYPATAPSEMDLRILDIKMADH